MKIPKAGVQIREVTNNVNRFLDQQMKKYHIRHGQFEYMVTISMNEQVTMNELASIHGVAKASITKAVNKLIERNYVMRKICEDDGRINHISLTREGEALMDNFMKYRDIVESTLYGDLSKKEIDNFLSTLEKIAINSRTLIKD